MIDHLHEKCFVTYRSAFLAALVILLTTPHLICAQRTHEWDPGGHFYDAAESTIYSSLWLGGAYAERNLRVEKARDYALDAFDFAYFAYYDLNRLGGSNRET